MIYPASIRHHRLTCGTSSQVEDLGITDDGTGMDRACPIYVQIRRLMDWNMWPIPIFQVPNFPRLFYQILLSLQRKQMENVRRGLLKRCTPSTSIGLRLISAATDTEATSALRVIVTASRNLCARTRPVSRDPSRRTTTILSEMGKDKVDEVSEGMASCSEAQDGAIPQDESFIQDSRALCWAGALSRCFCGDEISHQGHLVEPC
ncbi:unnamed protein product [Diplocarpon coronariae]